MEGRSAEHVGSCLIRTRCNAAGLKQPQQPQQPRPSAARDPASPSRGRPRVSRLIFSSVSLKLCYILRLHRLLKSLCDAAPAEGACESLYRPSVLTVKIAARATMPKVPRHSRHHLHLQERAWPFNPAKYTGHIPTIAGQRKQLVSIIDEHGFNWQVWAVAATGFFTDSYNLFASNIILPCLAFVYWGAEHEANIEITINALTLAGSCVGQVIFGFLADKYGRQRLYGIELMIVIFSTIGLAQSSVGWMNHAQDVSSMRADSWIMAWKFVMGIGIGKTELSKL